jgi:hypothetical protein
MYPQTTPILDFTVVDTHDLHTLAIADTSFYPDAFTIVNPSIEITPPSFPSITQPLATGTITIYNSNNLNITCVSDISLLTILPDGIWEATISVSPVLTYSRTKSFLRTENIRTKFGNAFLKTDITQCDMNVRIEQMKVIDEISLYIESAIAAANQCNYILSMQLYQTADTMLTNFLRGRCFGTQQTLWC